MYNKPIFILDKHLILQQQPFSTDHQLFLPCANSVHLLTISYFCEISLHWFYYWNVIFKLNCMLFLCYLKSQITCPNTILIQWTHLNGQTSHTTTATIFNWLSAFPSLCTVSTFIDNQLFFVKIHYIDFTTETCFLLNCTLFLCCLKSQITFPS